MKHISTSVVVLVLMACSAEPPAERPTGPDVEPEPEFSCRSWQPLEGGTTASFRGLSAVDENVVWVSGTGGTWGRSDDGGVTWQMRVVPGAEELDFRDVDAFDATMAYLMSAGPGEASRIFKTTDGGETWELQHTNTAPDGFFDGMAFWTPERGLVYGDPVDARFVVLGTADGGATWSRVPAGGMPPALEGEAGFAASGSGLAVAPGGHAWFGTGGPEARVFRSSDYGQSWTVASTPLRAGAGSSGIFSLAFHDTFHGVAVGGDYTLPEETAGNAARTTDGGLTWTAIEGSPPGGYRSAVAYAPGTDGRTLIAMGTNGSDVSLDGGGAWSRLSHDGFNAVDFVDRPPVAFGSGPCAAWAAGPEGTLARLDR
jgi:photosystem II stability/assembly factor-like uncharacterized protein